MSEHGHMAAIEWEKPNNWRRIIPHLWSKGVSPEDICSRTGLNYDSVVRVMYETQQRGLDYESPVGLNIK